MCGINSYGCGVCCVTGLTFVRGLPSSLIFIQDVGRQRQAATTGDRRYVGSHVVRPPTGLNYLTTAVNNNNNNRQQIPSYQHFRHPARSPNQHKRMVPQRRLPVNANQLSVLHEIKPWLYYNTHTHTRPFLSDIPSSRWETCGEHISFHHFLFLFCIFFLHFFFCERPLVSPEPNHRLFNGEFMRTPSTPISFSSSSSSSSALSTLLRLSVYIATVVYSSCLYMCIYLYISLDDILGRDL